MPPSFKFTKDEITKVALNLIRESGINSLTARSLAQKLGTSPKPIFSLFSGMEEVKAEVISMANEKYQDYLKAAMEKGEYPPYKASGMGYIRFAKEETELFKLLFMRNRQNEEITKSTEEIAPIIEILQKNLNLSQQTAYLFHLEMWVYVHGIATMLATSYLEWDLDFISNSLTDIYEGLKRRHCNGIN
ncbi:MAG: TetR/AcrR family transcriptional regulator [Clostridia bacterium]|nr:TetR/AcrR family transcriptional regulator [Clostridia bacterium]